MFMINIADIKPATYNPREISEEKIELLKESISKNGFVLPILVNRQNNVIIAGHQRTKAATSLGIDKVPAFFVDHINVADEIKFNQIHNGTDTEIKALARLNEKQIKGFSMVNPDVFTVEKPSPPIVKEMCKLMLKYGNVLCVVADDKSVLIGANYIRACELLKLKVNLSYIENKESRSLLKEEYGEFSYKNLKKNTWVQGLAQLHRNREKGDRLKANKSSLYENHVLKNISVEDSVLDFGCGKATYISTIENKEAIGVEFYNNNSSSINVSKGQKQIDKLVDFIKRKNKFNVVVCDSVLNSVDSMEAESAILGSLNVFCEIGGKLFISGRPNESATIPDNQKTDRNTKLRTVYFLDKDGLTAMFRKGQWFYQRFHKRQDAIDLVERNGFRVDLVSWRKHGNSWQIEATKIKDLPKEQQKKAIELEFNLPLPDGTSYNRHKEIIELYNLDKE